MVKRWGAADRESDVEIYRANHHGSANSSTQDLLDALDPEFILYSTGGGYGHPSADPIQRGAVGAVQLITDGASLKTWPNGLPEELGRVVGEIEIEVAAGGAAYRIEGRNNPSWSQRQERDGLDVRPNW